jgi:hypothetical protein
MIEYIAAIAAFAGWIGLCLLACQRGEPRPLTERDVLDAKENNPMDLHLDPPPLPSPYVVYEWVEATGWRHAYTGYSLATCECVGAGLKSGMPWKVVRDGKVVSRCHGDGVVIEA